MSKPRVVIIAGPNGAGKSTSAPRALKGGLEVTEFVNADTIARGLSAFEPERVALTAGRIMLERLRELAAARADFAFETTLASRSFAPWISGLIASGYEFHLIDFWLPSPEMAIARVSGRVRSGGHNVPPETVQRRYYGGIRNFFELYQPLADTWRVYNNADRPGAKLISSGAASSDKGSIVPKTGNKSSHAATGRKAKPSRPKPPTGEDAALDRAIRRATRQAVLTHKKLGQSIVVWRGGKVVWLKPSEI